MKEPLIAAECCKPASDRLLRKILRRGGAYYHSGALFYHELWQQRLASIGLRVRTVERFQSHPVWDLRLRGGLTAQTYLLVCKPVPARLAGCKDLLSIQLEDEIRQIAVELGCPIKRDAIAVVRTGAYFRVGFVWPLGKPGRWVEPAKKPAAFSVLIRPWLRKNRN